MMAIDVAGLAAATVAAYCLWRGSEEVPWDMQTWNGKNEQERAFKRARRRWANVGFLLLGVGFGLQIVARFV